MAPTFSEKIGDQIGLVDEANLPAAIERVGVLINYASARFSSYEAEREKLMNISIAIIALSGTLQAVLVSSENIFGSISYIFIWLAIVCALICSCVSIVVFSYGTKRVYTHRGLADVKAWFFHYSLKGFKGRLVDGGESDREQLAESFGVFGSSMVKHVTDKRDQLSSDLQQLYILHIFQGISSANHKLMIEIVRWESVVICLLLIIACLLNIFGF